MSAAQTGAWADRAACKGHTDLFFPPSKRHGYHEPIEQRTARIIAAVDICQRCPVRRQCFAFATDTHQQHGIWGAVVFDPRPSRRRRHLTIN